MKNHVTVLGAGGFIGSSVAKHFDESDFSVSALTSSDVDLCDIKAATAKIAKGLEGATLVFCAGRHRQRGDTYEIMTQNLAMVQSVIEASKIEKPSHIIFLSSVEVYGAPETMPINEQTTLNPMSLYAVGKVTCEMMLKLHAEKSGIELSMPRLPGIYGPHDGSTSIITRMVEASRGNGVFKMFGDGSDLRDYVLVDDLAKLVLALASLGKGVGVVNVASGSSISITQLLDIVGSIHATVPLETVPDTAKHFNLLFDTAKLSNNVPDVSFTSLEDGIKKYV